MQNDRNDLINRQAVIDALEKVAELYPWRVPGDRDSYSSYNEAWQDALNRVENDIEALPSVQSEHWIPCSERLPEESGLYIVTNVGRWVEPVGTRYYNIRADFNFWSGHQSDKVLAWMPLPAPYREEGEK